MPTELYLEHQEFCDKRLEVLCKEQGIKYTLINNTRHKIAKIKVDGGVFPTTDRTPNEHKKCDYLLVDCDAFWGILVELKGTDCLVAIEQINMTLDLTKNHLNKHRIQQVHGRIVLRSTKHTDRTSSQRKQLDKKLKKFFGGGTLKIEKSPFKDSL